MTAMKIKYADDDELLGDLGTVYLETENSEFVKKVLQLDDYRELVKFLDKYKSLYVECREPLDSYDYIHDITEFTNTVLNDINIPFSEK